MTAKKGLPEGAYYAQFPHAGKAMENDVEDDAPVPFAKNEPPAKPVDVRQLILGEKTPPRKKTVFDDTFDTEDKD